MRIESGDLLLRPWQPGDEEALMLHGDNPRIARNLSDRFPEPCDRAAAEAWLRFCADEDPVESFAIVCDGVVVGGAVCRPRKGEYRYSLGLGYWVGESHWGRGIATRAVRLLVSHAFTTTDAVRIEADVFGWNPASARVLEKAGFQAEGRQRNAIIKHGAFTDLLLFGLLREEWEADARSTAS